MKSNTPPPIAIRKLRAAIETKWLSKGEIAQAVSASESRVSEILNGKRVDPELLGDIRRFVEAAPVPVEVAA